MSDSDEGDEVPVAVALDAVAAERPAPAAGKPKLSATFEKAVPVTLITGFLGAHSRAWQAGSG